MEHYKFLITEPHHELQTAHTAPFAVLCWLSKKKQFEANQKKKSYSMNETAEYPVVLIFGERSMLND